MKTKFCALAAFSFFALAQVPAHAQFADRAVERPVQNPVFSAEAADLTRQMSSRLHLNEGQYVKLYAVNRTRVAQLGEINNYFKSDEAGRAARLAELDAQYEQECSRILSPSQLSQMHQEQGTPNVPADNGNGRG